MVELNRFGRRILWLDHARSTYRYHTRICMYIVSRENFGRWAIVESLSHDVGHAMNNEVCKVDGSCELAKGSSCIFGTKYLSNISFK